MKPSINMNEQTYEATQNVLNTIRVTLIANGINKNKINNEIIIGRKNS